MEKRIRNERKVKEEEGGDGKGVEEEGIIERKWERNGKGGGGRDRKVFLRDMQSTMCVP